MEGYASQGLVEEWLSAFASKYSSWVSLHNDAPSVGEPTNSEFLGGSYTRKEVRWTPVRDRCLTNENDLRWTGLDPSAIGGFGVFVTERLPGRNPSAWIRAGGFAFGIPLSLDERRIVGDGTFVIPRNSLEIVL